MNCWFFIAFLYVSVTAVNCQEYDATTESFTSMADLSLSNASSTTNPTTTPYPGPLPPSALSVLLGAIFPVLISIACISYLICRMQNPNRASFINLPFNWNTPSSPTPSRQGIISRSNNATPPPPEYSARAMTPPPYSQQPEEPPPSYDSLVFESENGAKSKDDTAAVNST